MAKKKLATVQLTEAVCIFCGKSGVLLTNEDPPFGSAVCPDDMMKLLRTWKPPQKGNGEATPTTPAAQPGGQPNPHAPVARSNETSSVGAK